VHFPAWLCLPLFYLLTLSCTLKLNDDDDDIVVVQILPKHSFVIAPVCTTLNARFTVG